MITGHINDIGKILPYLSNSLQKALQYLAVTDFSSMPNGEYEIDGREIFARVNTYATERKEERRPEKHNDYIDVQFVARGRETIWFTPFTPDCRVTEDLSQENDVLFYADPGEQNCVQLEAGSFAIFFPWELHRPNCSGASKAEQVQKVVVKVKSF